MERLARRNQFVQRLLDLRPQFGNWQPFPLPRHTDRDRLHRVQPLLRPHRLPIPEPPLEVRRAYPHYATRQQLVALLNADMPEHLWAYILIRLATGCRGDAARDLQPFQVDFHAKLIRLNPPGRRQTKKYRPVVPLIGTLAAFLKTRTGDAHYVNWHGEKVGSVRRTWDKVRVAAGLPDWFVQRILRHTVGTELRRRGVPGWEVSGLLGHKKGESAATTENYAKFDPAYLRKAARALDAWLADLAKDVPKLHPFCGVSRGSAAAKSARPNPVKTTHAHRLKVVGGTGIEPVTPTMSR